MSWAELKNVVRRVPAPPCNGCPQRKRCAQEKLSCRDFVKYVHLQSWRGNSDRKASRGRYISMFSATDDE
jgi:hypothetical protein